MGREGNHRNSEERKNFVLSKKAVSKKLKIEQSVLVVENIEKAPVPQNLPLYNQYKIHL